MSLTLTRITSQEIKDLLIYSLIFIVITTTRLMNNGEVSWWRHTQAQQGRYQKTPDKLVMLIPQNVT